MTTAIEFPRKATADAVREEYPDALCSDDDRRLKTVRFSSDALEHVLEDAERRAAMARGEREGGAGQAELTDAESDRIDFSQPRANIPHAKSVKALAVKHGVDDWLAYYDGTLSVDEHREIMERAARDERGQRMDSHEGRQAERMGRAAARAAGEECNHAAGHCRMGDPEACEYLQESCDYDQEEIEQLTMAEFDDAGDDAGEITGKAAGALQRAWNGYKAGSARFGESLADAREEWQHAQQAARAINAIRAEHGQDRLRFEVLEDAQGRLSTFAREAARDCHECHGLDLVPAEQQASDDDVQDAVDDALETDAGAQQTLGGEAASRDEQARLDVEADVRQAQGQQRRVEAEQSQGGLTADTRSDPSRGARSRPPETEQRSFRDPDQEQLDP